MNLTLDGLDLVPADGRWKFWIPEGIDDVPEVRGGSVVVPFRHGRTRHERMADRRKVLLKGHVKAADVRAAIDELKAVLSPSETERVLLCGDPLGLGDDRWTNVVVENVIATVGSSTVRLYSIELEADPFWYSDWGAWTLDMGLVLDDGLYLDETDGYLEITPDSADYTATFNAIGTAPITKVRVEVDGASTGAVTVKNDTTGIGFTFPALSATDNLVVDSGLRTVTLEAAQARNSLTLLTPNEHGEYIRLEAGSNTIRITGQPAVVRLYFSTAWL